MKKKNLVKERYTNWLYDHSVAKNILDNLFAFVLSTLSSIIFALGFKIFVLPTQLIETGAAERIVTGGASGLSQTFSLILVLIFGNKVDENLLISIFYFIVNIPLLLITYFKVSKRFTFLSLINVLETSICLKLFDTSYFSWLTEIAEFVNEEGGGMLARVIFGGVFVGLSSALPYKADFSAGGIDIISYIISNKKDNSTGQYTIIINAVIIIAFTLIQVSTVNSTSEILTKIAIVPYCILYLFVVGLVVDSIHIRNKKVEIKIITEDKELTDYLLSQIAHGATISEGEGAFTGSKKRIISMVVSSYECRKIVKSVKEQDPKAFIEVFELVSVFGRFHKKPIK